MLDCTPYDAELYPQSPCFAIIVQSQVQIPLSMEQSEKLNAEIGLEKKNTLLQAWADFKDSIFNVLFVILDKRSEEEEEQSLMGLIFESGLDYLQIMAFPFQDLVIDAWNGGDSLSGLARFFKKLSISSYLPGAPYGVFLAMLYGLIFIIILIILDIVYVSYSFSKKKFRFTFPLVILAQIVPLFVTVFFIPISESLLNVVECEKTLDGVWQMTAYPDVECWTGWHLFHACFTLLFAMVFMVISTVVALALFEPRMTSNKLTSRQNSNGEVVFILNKIVLQFIFVFSPFQGSGFYVVTMFVLAFWQFWCYAVKQPYYSKTATKFFKIVSTYYFWTALMLFVGQVLGSYGFNGALVIWMSGLPFFAVIIYFESTSDISKLFVNNLKFKSGEQLEQHISYVLQLVGSQGLDKNSYMLLIGYIEKHKEICNEPDCPLKGERRRKKGEDSMDHSCQQMLRQVERMFRSGIKKFPECTKLRISFAFFQLEHLRNKERAYEEFSAASLLDTSFQQQFNIYRFKKIIRENLENREENDADLIETIRFENHVSLLEEAMLQSAKLHKEFWAELKEEVPDLKKLNLIGAQITETGNSIAENFKEISKINPSACEVLYSYAHYLMLVSKDTVEGRELLANARKIFQDRQTGHRNVESLHLEEGSLNKMTSPLLVLSADPNPKILNANLMFTEVTGYQREELVGKELGKVAPKLFHSQGISCVELGGEDKEQDGFLNHKFNHLIPVHYSFAHPSEESEWHVLFKLASSTSMKLVLLVNQQGDITDYNLLAQTAMKALQDEATQSGRTLSMADLDLAHFNSPQFQRQIGCSTRIRFGDKTGQCIVQVQELLSHVYGQNQEAEDEGERMMILSEKSIGFKVIISKGERIHLSESSVSLASSQPELREGQLDEGILELYDNPNVIDIFLSNLAETRQFDESQNRFELKEKITTMRLLNNEIKMVYAQGNENDYSDLAGNNDSEEDRELFKFDDESYQAKLKAAINTNLNHVEVGNLRKASILFLLLLFTLNGLELFFEGQEVGKVNEFLKEISRRAEEYSLLSSNIMAVINPSANYSSLYGSNSQHKVAFESQVQVSLLLENNFTISRNLKDAVILLNSRLLSYFQYPSAHLEISSIFLNYISAIYPAFLDYPASVEVSLVLDYLLSAGVLLISLLMMGYWIYIGLLIDKKRYDIMIWFLDIPVPYVTHLGTHCDKYLKEFATVKELTAKGVPLQEDEESYEEYSVRRGGSDEEEIEEQIKARKSLISKNKKETLLSKVSCGSMTVCWLLVYAACFSILMLVLSSGFNQDYDFLMPQWRQSYQAVVVDSTLYLTLQMSRRNVSAGATSLSLLARSLELQHKGVITEYKLEDFNYNILSFHLPEVAQAYNSVYFNNLCLTLSLQPTQLDQCQTLVGSKLKSGYEVYSKYLITPEPKMADEIWKANELYVLPALLGMLSQWEQSMSTQGSGFISLCTILLYVFVILSVLSFLLFWLYYLRKLNTELNQTIQMLNMIPFKLLPKSRKETKAFIAWIIREANKTKHEDE